MVSTSGGIKHPVAIPEGVLASLLAWEAGICVDLTHDCLLGCRRAALQVFSILPSISHMGGFLPGWNVDSDYLESHSHEGETEGWIILADRQTGWSVDQVSAVGSRKHCSKLREDLLQRMEWLEL